MPMKSKILLLIVFASGLFIGAFVFGHQKQPSKTPIETSFCFLQHNLELFAERQFLTSAHMWFDLHGGALLDPACSKGVLTYKPAPDLGNLQREFAGEVSSELARHTYVDIPITFIGKLNSPSRLESAFFWMESRIGKKVKRKPDVTITRIISFEKPAR
jgi:hypothetical protein